MQYCAMPLGSATGPPTAASKRLKTLMPQQRVLVGFKRDLHIHDHAALAAAQAHGNALTLFIIETE
jgi:hypothetical protein